MHFEFLFNGKDNTNTISLLSLFLENKQY